MDVSNCKICPRGCGVRRDRGQTGLCGMTDTLRVAMAMLHQWEEPVISGTKGSGAVFFSGCNLRCAFCQKAPISQEGRGQNVTQAQLRQIFEKLIAQGAENIDLITATHFVPQILPALEPKLPVPVAYNCGGYESVETLERLEGKVDIYLPDFKYADNRLAWQLSRAGDYFQVATAAIREMFRQVGPPVIEDGKLKRGVMVRHLILPGCVDNSLRVLDWLGEHFAPGEILVSLMRQYTPMGPAASTPPFDRMVTDEEYDAVLSWMYLNDLEGFTQEQAAAGADCIPHWDEWNLLDFLSDSGNSILPESGT